VLGALAASKAITTPVAPVSAHGVADEATIGADFTQDTLEKGDRLEITYVRPETPLRSALQPTEPSIAPIPTIAPPVETKIISRHWHDPNAVGSSLARSKQPGKMVVTGRGKSADPKGNQTVDRSKLTDEVKRCNQPGALGGLLRSLNLSPACDS